MPRPFIILILIFILIPLAACHHSTATDNPNLTAQVEGKGKLLSLDQTLGMGTLDIKGKTVTFWWNNQISRPGSEGDPEVRTTQVPFNANIGDTIYFRGLQKRGTIYITAAATEKK